MTINLYQNIFALNRCARSLNNPLAISGFLRDDCDIFAPDIEVEYNAAYLQYNYAFIPEYNRYYSFKESPTVSGKKMILHLEADSLWNWKNVIMNSQCIAERSSSNFDVMIEDSAVLSVAGYTYFSRSLPYEFKPDHGTYVLMVAGGQ